MKKLILLFIILPGIIFCQNTMTFTFTGVDDSSYFQLDSIRIKNLTQAEDTLLIYPDTVLIFNYVGMNENPLPFYDFRVLQNFPNPVEDWTVISFYIPDKDEVEMKVTDIRGRNLITLEKMLDKGQHFFRFIPSGERIYLFTAYWRGSSRTIKVLNIGSGSGRDCLLEYSGSEKIHLPQKSNSATQEFPFSPGDELMLIGYGDGLGSGFRDVPGASQDYTFQFATNIPCPNMDSLFYEGQWYHTIQIFSQCWMKENLNAGIMINHSQNQTDNEIMEKYCLGDYSSYCDIYGGLYFWDEMMKYAYENNAKGICPEGWHIPGDVDWQILEGAVDSVYEIGANAWKYSGWRGTEAGGNLKEKGTAHWTPPNAGATDNFGFRALPAGYFVQNDFWGIEYKTYFWSSHPTQKYYRNMDWNQAKINRNAGSDDAALSVRCIRN
jgi:uncharacterized protein (TIGR02145 family)